MPKTKDKALSAKFIASIRKPGAYTDGNGLTLKVDGNLNRRWFQRIRLEGKRRNLGIGGYPAVSLRDARAVALSNLNAARQGLNPAPVTAPIRPTFKEVADKVKAIRERAWTSPRHAKQWNESLRIHAQPILAMPVDTVTATDVMALLTPIWDTKRETALRLRGRIETIFDFAVAMDWRTDNPAAKVRAILPKQGSARKHHAALPYAQVPDAIKRVQESTARPAVKLATEFLILTAARLGEVTGATWAEIDVDGETWAIPAERMKMRRAHRVPLSPRAVAILKEARALPGGGPLVFPGENGQRMKGYPIRRLNIAATIHGFRSSFRDWTLEQTATPWAVAEAALAHQVGNSVESAYARTDLFDKRRALMDAWAAFVG